jgi:hypothetical protein
LQEVILPYFLHLPGSGGCLDTRKGVNPESYSFQPGRFPPWLAAKPQVLRSTKYGWFARFAANPGYNHAFSGPSLNSK